MCDLLICVYVRVNQDGYTRIEKKTIEIPYEP